MRIALASIGQETCSFNPTRTGLEIFKQFGLYEGAEVLHKAQQVGAIAGFLAAAEEEEIDLTPLPIIRAWGGSGGTITAETLAFFEQKIVAGLEQVLPVDGLFFDLHGAAMAEKEPDLEGYLLAAARRVIGPDVPLVTPLDHHANMTRQMIESVDGLLAHRTQPHDPFDTGRRAAKLLFAMLRGEFKPAIAWQKIPLLTHQEQYLTSKGPMKAWFDRAFELEKEPGVVSISNFPMQPWFDAPEGGWTTVVITDNDHALAQKLAAELADMAWQLREDFWQLDSISPAAAIRRAVEADRGLVVLADTGDSVFGGATGDSNCLLREMLNQQIPCPALVPMLDAEVVELAVQAGVGSEITVKIGGKLDNVFSQPLEVTGRVAAIGGGRLEANVIGLESFDMGRAVLFEAGPIKIVVSEHKGVGGNHPITYRHFGIEPAEAKMVVLKTASNFQYYQAMMSELVRVDTPGLTTSHLDQFEWSRIPRPIYPLDDLPAWQAATS